MMWYSWISAAMLKPPQRAASRSSHLHLIHTVPLWRVVEGEDFTRDPVIIVVEK